MLGLFPRSAKLVYPAAKNTLALGTSDLGPQIDLGASQAPPSFEYQSNISLIRQVFQLCGLVEQ